MLALFAFLAGAGCSPEVVTDTVANEGSVCQNDAGDIEVTFPGCLSSSCDTLVSATCEATLVGGVLEITAEAVIESVGETCTMDCGIIQARCEMPLIEDPQTVVFEYAGEQTALDAECQGI